MYLKSASFRDRQLTHANNRKIIENWIVFRSVFLRNSARESNKIFVTSGFVRDQTVRKIWKTSATEFTRSVPFANIEESKSAGFRDIEAQKNEDTEALQATK